LEEDEDEDEDEEEEEETWLSMHPSQNEWRQGRRVEGTLIFWQMLHLVMLANPLKSCLRTSKRSCLKEGNNDKGKKGEKCEKGDDQGNTTPLRSLSQRVGSRKKEKENNESGEVILRDYEPGESLENH
jgi:hypothetical protein